MIVLIPVLLIAFISIILMSLLVRAVNFFRKKRSSPLPHYRVETNLFSNQYWQINLVEDEDDRELTQLNISWNEQVYDDSTYLYRAKTSPMIEGLHNQVIGNFIRQTESELILQMLEPTTDNPLNTAFVLLEKTTGSIKRIGDCGALFVYNDQRNPDMVKGFNKEQRVHITLTKVDEHS